MNAQHTATLSSPRVLKKHDYRLTHSKPIVDQFLGWCTGQLQGRELTSQHKLRKALNYVVKRRTELDVFFGGGTELGAEHRGLLQSLLST